jgi:hypothetical protein
VEKVLDSCNYIVPNDPRLLQDIFVYLRGTLSPDQDAYNLDPIVNLSEHPPIPLGFVWIKEEDDESEDSTTKRNDHPRKE